MEPVGAVTGSTAGGCTASCPVSDPDALYEGRDLPVSTDFRAVFSEAAGRHFGIANDEAMFPGWRGGRLPLLRV